MQQPGNSYGIWGGPAAVVSTLTDRFNSDVSTSATVRVMRGLAHRYAQHPFVSAAAAHALQGRILRTHRDAACAVFHWVRKKIRFVYDETLLYEQLGIGINDLDKELLIVPPLLLRMRPPQGDCDDFSLLLASMFLSLGMRPYFVTVAADRAEPRKFSHIYVCVELGDEQTHICLDAGNRLPMVRPGWEVRNVTRKAIFPV